MKLMDRYLRLLERAVLGELQFEAEVRLLAMRQGSALTLGLSAEYARVMDEGRVYRDDLRNLGFAPTMIGRARLANVRECLESIVADKVAGDVIECGVLRGGAALYMRGWLAAHDVSDRVVWLADSFEGLPAAVAPEESEDLRAEQFPMLAVDIDTVRGLFARYDLLDDQVRFLQGWFAETLPSAPIERLALLRIDADYYASTMDALTALYDRVSVGGFVIVDDYGCIPACQLAVDRFRAARGIMDPLLTVDWTGVYWRRSEPVKG